MTDDTEQGDLFSVLANPFPPETARASRYEEMRAAAAAFHRRHPEVMRLFDRFTFDRIRRGFRNYSVNGIFERIRWETDQAEVDGNQFKLNNNHRPFYARSFMHRHPEHAGFFRTRRQTSRDGFATGLSELGPEDFE